MKVSRVMNNFFVMTLTILIPVLVGLPILGQSQAAESHVENKNKNKNKKMYRKSGLTSERTFRKLKRAHTLIANKDTKSALEILQKLVKKTERKPFEQAQAYQAIGFVYAQQEGYKAALEYFSKALALKRLPVSATLSTMFTVAQLQISTQNIDAGVRTLEEWFEYTETPSSQAYMLLGMAYGEQKRFKKAIVPVKKAIVQSDLQKKQRGTSAAKEQWFQFLLALHYDLNQYTEATKVLEELVRRYPENQKYWKQLSGMLLNQDLNQRATAVMELAYKQGYVTNGGDLKNFAILLMDQGVPLKSAQILERAILAGQVKPTPKNWSMVASGWAMAKETQKAINAYGKAGSLAGNGESYVKQGQLYSDLEEWDAAIKSLTQGLEKGGVKNPGRVLLLIGVARYHLHDAQGAVLAFNKAKRHRKTKKQAKVWLAYFSESN